MKLKGLARALVTLENLEQAVSDKVDEIEWSGDHDTKDQQKDEMFNAARDSIDAAMESLKEIQELQLEDF